MVVHVQLEVSHEHVLSLLLHVVIDNRRVELHDEHLKLASFPHLPQVTRKVEEKSLGEGGGDSFMSRRELVVMELTCVIKYKMCGCIITYIHTFTII